MFIKPIIKFVFIVILLVVIFIIYSNSNKVNSPTQDANNNTDIPMRNESAMDTITEISYTDSGFSPSNINIALNETVKFTNNSTKKMWVASDPHPAHTIYPEFDAKKAMDSGESYTFTFTKLGSWGFHNHFNPEDKGTVVVNAGRI
jgi:plastocyanin